MKKKRTLEELLKSEKFSELVADLSFEEGIALLEELVVTVETGTLPLEQAIGSYERGVALVAQLRRQLEGAEQRLKILQPETVGSKEAAVVDSKYTQGK